MAIDPITDNLLGVAINIEAKKEKREQTLEECLDEYADHRYVVSFSTHLKKKWKKNTIFDQKVPDWTYALRGNAL